MESPVWVWLDGATAPVRIGTLRRDDATRIIGEWQEVLDELKAPVKVADETSPTLEWTRQILAEAASLSVDDCRPVAPKSSHRWQWAP